MTQEVSLPDKIKILNKPSVFTRLSINDQTIVSNITAFKKTARNRYSHKIEAIYKEYMSTK
jgi:hypothetical protein